MSNNSLLNFCPECMTLLLTKKTSDDEVHLKCPNCEYSSPITKLHIIHSNKFTDDQSTQLVPYATIFDDSVKRTTRVRCRNESCATINPDNWGDVNDRGIKVEPNVIIATVYDANRIATYICRVCGMIFKP